jgi:DNA-binding GntR family transcriptional regulator
VTQLIDDTLPLAEAAYRRLRDDIIWCRLQPGQRITERGLAKQTGLGVSPVRDALTRLDHEGLVRTIPRKGYQVTPLTLKSVDDLFSFWQIIGPEVVRRGVVNATDEQLDRIAQDFSEIEQASPGKHDTPELLHIVELGNELFATLAQASGNSYLAATYNRLSGELFRVWTLIADSDLKTPSNLVDVMDWFDLIRRREGDALAASAREYIRALSDHVERTLARWPSVMTSEVVPLQTP